MEAQRALAIDHLAAVRMRAVVVGADPFARDTLRLTLHRDMDVDVVAEAAHGDAAVRAIREHLPEVAFLDVHLQAKDVVRVLDELAGSRVARVVFVGTSDDGTLKTYEVHSVDCNLHRFDGNQSTALRALELGIGRVRHTRSTTANTRHVTRAEPAFARRERARRIHRLMVKSKRRILFINAEDVDWIESAGNYVRLHCGGTSYLLRETMMALEQSLDPERFTRIHRSTMVNVDRVAEIQANACGDYDLILTSGERLRMSRGYRHRMLR